MTDALSDALGTSGGNRASRGTLGSAVLRIALGLTLFFTWLENVDKDFYDGENFPGFFSWVFTSAEDGGNGSSLGFVESIVDSTLLAAPEFFGWLLTFFELAIAICMLFGIFTRAASLAALGFFVSLFLVYFGGEEWIWTYVLLVASSIAVFLNWGGRTLGVDQFIASSRGESPATLIW